MCAVSQYHITMLVTGEQEDVIRATFRERNWPCWIKVLSDESVAKLIQDGNTDIFPILSEGQDGGIGHSVFTEIKSEIIDLDSDENILHGATEEGKAEVGAYSLQQPHWSDEDDTVSMDYDTCMSQRMNQDCTDMGEKQPVTTKSADIKSDKVNNLKTDGQNRVKCELCFVTFVSKAVYRKHCKKYHSGQWLAFDCKDCDSRFKTKEDLWEHRKEAKHKPREPGPLLSEKMKQTPEELKELGHLQCNFCMNFYQNKRSLRRHMVKVHRDWMLWNCAVCFEGFKSRDELNAHKREKQHKTSTWTLGNHQCDSCGKIYQRFDSFSEHKIACSKTPEEIKALKVHPCDICGLTFKSSIRVKSHKRNVHVDDPVVCHVCGTVCKNKRALLVHRRRHDMRKKKYRCNSCGKCFFNNTLLEQHERTHSKEKPFKCPVCPYTCAIKQNIHKHSKKVHKIQYQAIDMTKIRQQDVHLAGIFSDLGEPVMDIDSNHGALDLSTQFSQAATDSGNSMD